MRRLAHREELPVGREVALARIRFVAARGVHRRAEADHDFILLARAQDAGDVEPVLDQHVGRPAHLLAVHPNRRDAIEAAKAEHGALAR